MNSENQTPKQFPHENKLISIKDIMRGGNARKITSASPGIKDLAENIKATGGVLQPVIARKIPVGYELLAGERRLVASMLAGFTEINAEIYQVDDADAQLITVTENLQRQDLTPLEEAAAIKTLINTGKDLKTIAADLGRPLTFVIRRARLTMLTPEWLMAIAGKEPPKHIKAILGAGGANGRFSADDFKDWPIAAMEMIARYDAEMQNFILARLCYTRSRGATESIQNLERFLGELSHQIKKAPWPINEASLLPKAGACDTCPKRSSHNPGLFEDDLTPEKVTAADKCLDIQCWNAKMEAYQQRRLAKLQADYPNLVKITEGWHDHPGVLIRDKYSIVKKSDKGAVPAVIVDGDSRGKLQWIKVSGQGSKSSRPKGKDGKPVAASKEDRYKKLADRRNAHAINALRELLDDDENPHNYPKFANKHKNPIKAVASLILVFGQSNADFDYEFKKDDFDMAQLFADSPDQDVLKKLWIMVVPMLKQEIFFDTAERATGCLTAAEKICELLEIEFDKYLKLAEEAIPAPKSLAKLDEEEKPKAEKKPAADNPKKAAKPKAESSGKAKPKKVKRGSLLKKK